MTMSVYSLCVHGRKCTRGGRSKKIDGRPPETLIRNLVQYVEMVAPPPLVPFTEEPLSLVGNPASWVSLMCPLCLEILNSPVELVTCESIVCHMLLCLA